MKYGDKFATKAIKIKEAKPDDDRIEVTEDAYSIGFMIDELIKKLDRARVSLK